MVSMGRRRFPWDLDFSLRFDGEPVSISKLTCFLRGSGDRLVTVARRGLDGVDVARIPGTLLASSQGKAGRVLSTLGASSWVKADVDEVFWSLKIWLALKALRGRRDDCAV
jgi:hypothetical protein